jgi:hypothetical protein
MSKASRLLVETGWEQKITEAINKFHYTDADTKPLPNTTPLATKQSH